MANVYAHMEFTDPSGEPREIGEQFDLPRETDFEQAEFARLLEWGAVGEDPPAEAAGTGKQRTSARDRAQRDSAEES